METPVPKLHVVLYQPEIPANTGAVGRTCVAVGAKLWLVRPLGFQINDRQLKRAGLDYWQHLQWQTVDDWEALLRQLPQASDHAWFFSKTAGRAYTNPAFAAGDVLVFGSETAGLPPSFLAQQPERALRIPIRPEVRSLNLSVSVGIAVYEAVRQIG